MAPSLRYWSQTVVVVVIVELYAASAAQSFAVVVCHPVTVHLGNLKST